MELGGNGYFSPGVVGEAENGLRPSRLFCSVFYSASSILVFLLCLWVGSLSGDGRTGDRGDNSYYFVVNVMLYPDMMLFVVSCMVVNLDFMIM